MRVCPTPGCPVLTHGGRCQACSAQADRNRGTPSERGYDQKWRRTRQRYLNHHPWCEQLGCDQPATQVHHIDGQGPLGPDGHHWHNLRALCQPHHATVTAADQPGGWNQQNESTRTARR